jgi:hypothetical protein
MECCLVETLFDCLHKGYGLFQHMESVGNLATFPLNLSQRDPNKCGEIHTTHGESGAQPLRYLVYPCLHLPLASQG